MVMNIWAKRGDKVIYKYPNNGYPHDQEDAKKYLVLNKVYTVKETVVWDSISYVWLEEIPGIPFNCGHFEDCGEN